MHQHAAGGLALGLGIKPVQIVGVAQGRAVRGQLVGGSFDRIRIRHLRSALPIGLEEGRKLLYTVGPGSLVNLLVLHFEDGGERPTL